MSWLSRVFVVHAKGVRRGEQLVGNTEQGVRAIVRIPSLAPSTRQACPVFNASGTCPTRLTRSRSVPDASNA